MFWKMDNTIDPGNMTFFHFPTHTHFSERLPRETTFQVAGTVRHHRRLQQIDHLLEPLVSWITVTIVINMVNYGS
jgi:hypothetical protein